MQVNQFKSLILFFVLDFSPLTLYSQLMPKLTYQSSRLHCELILSQILYLLNQLQRDNNGIQQLYALLRKTSVGYLRFYSIKLPLFKLS